MPNSVTNLAFNSNVFIFATELKLCERNKLLFSLSFNKTVIIAFEHSRLRRKVHNLKLMLHVLASLLADA